MEQRSVVDVLHCEFPFRVIPSGKLTQLSKITVFVGKTPNYEHVLNTCAIHSGLVRLWLNPVIYLVNHPKIYVRKPYGTTSMETYDPPSYPLLIPLLYLIIFYCILLYLITSYNILSCFFISYHISLSHIILYSPINYPLS